MQMIKNLCVLGKYEGIVSRRCSKLFNPGRLSVLIYPLVGVEEVWFEKTVARLYFLYHQ